jgi:hypothetical protein
LRIAEKLDVVDVSASSGTTKQALDFVEGSTPSKTEKKETSSRGGGGGKLKAPASRARANEDRIDVKSECDTTLDHGIIRDEKS